MRIGLAGDRPFFVFFGCFLIVFVDGVELVERDLFFKLIEVEYPHLDDSFGTFIGSIGSPVLPLLVYGV